MPIPLFRFTLINDQLGTKEISEPDGWKKAVLKLERDPQFHSLSEYFEGSFTFYGNNGVDNGGIDFIKNVENIYGVDSKIQILIDISLDLGHEFENIFTGRLDLYTIQETKNNKLSCAIIRNDLWAKFINRKDTPINLKSTTNLDGNVNSIGQSVNIDLSPQKLPQTYNANLSEAFSAWEAPAINKYLQVNMDNNILDEIEERFTLPNSINPELPVSIIDATYSGDYVFTLRIELSMWVRLDLMPIPTPVLKTMQYSGGGHFVDFYIESGSWNVQFTKTEYTPNANKQSTVYTLSTSKYITAGDQIRIYGIINHNLPTTDSEYGGGGLAMFASIVTWGNTNNNVQIEHSGGFEDSNIDALSVLDGVPSQSYPPTSYLVTTQTTFPQTSSEAFLLHDAFGYVIDNITGIPNSFYSEFLGSTQTNYRSYAEDGCGWKNVIIQGLQLRGYSLFDKQFSVSFKKLWDGSDPILNLCLFYDVVNGQEVIRIEQKDYVYDKSSASVNFDNVLEIVRAYDNDRIFKKIEIGFNKWQSEDFAGIDDAQTKHTYATRFQTGGTDISIMSDFIAASLAIETTRRQTTKQSKDYKFDNDVFIIAINGIGVSPDRYMPELDENFDSITNLLNPETRYNSIHTPLRMLLRWSAYLNGCLQNYLTSSYKFVSGEGNYDMVSDYHCTSNDCDVSIGVICNTLSEKQDISLSTYGSALGFYHLPMLYNVQINMSFEDYKTIKANRHKAIGISQTTSGHKKFFIKPISYDICQSKCTMDIWPAEDAPLEVIT